MAGSARARTELELLRDSPRVGAGVLKVLDGVVEGVAERDGLLALLGTRGLRTRVCMTNAVRESSVQLGVLAWPHRGGVPLLLDLRAHGLGLGDLLECVGVIRRDPFLGHGRFGLEGGWR